MPSRFASPWPIWAVQAALHGKPVRVVYDPEKLGWWIELEEMEV